MVKQFVVVKKSKVQDRLGVVKWFGLVMEVGQVKLCWAVNEVVVENGFVVTAVTCLCVTVYGVTKGL